MLKFKKIIFVGLLLISVKLMAFDWGLLDKGSELLKDAGISDTVSSSLANQSEVIAGLKAALARGVETAIKHLGKENGFLNNDLVKINLPTSIKKAAQIAQKLGQGDQVDAFVSSMNRAAEKAVPQAADILGDAIRNMSVEDGMKILKGKDTAATEYFKKISSEKLKKQFLPIVKKATDQVGVSKQYKAIAGQASGLLSSVMGEQSSKALDLDRYITDKSLDGLYQYIALEEKKIRANPMATGSRILEKVFGK